MAGAQLSSMIMMALLQLKSGICRDAWNPASGGDQRGEHPRRIQTVLIWKHLDLHASETRAEAHHQDWPEILVDSQSSPSYSPSPELAHVLWMYLHSNTPNMSLQPIQYGLPVYTAVCPTNPPATMHPYRMHSVVIHGLPDLQHG